MAYKHETNLIFGPVLPPELDRVGLAFISAPFLSPDTAIASLAADRYANENYGHIADDVEIFTEGSTGQTLGISAYIPSTTLGGRYSPTGGGTIGPTLHTFKEDALSASLKILTSPIKVAGLKITPSDTWYPLIQPGTVWRRYTVSSLDPASGWIKLSGAVEGDQLWLIYAVPEYRYGTEYTSSSVFPDTSNYKYKKHSEICSVVGRNLIGYRGNIVEISDIYVNGSKQYTGTLDFSNQTESDYIKHIDRSTKTITLTKALLPDDEVLVEYLAYNDFYTYSGFKNIANSWFSFDANPEYGHWIGDELTNTVKNSSTSLLQQTTIYAVPTAYMKYVYEPAIPSTGTSLGRMILQFARAIDYGETHFIRHIVTGERLEQLDSRITNSSPKATWGHAVIGLNYYDEFGSISTDIFSRLVPTMLPLARVVLAAPASVNSVAVADIRVRGGGIPEDYALEAVEANGGLDSIRGYWDMATWSGAAVKEGGVVEVQIDTSILKTDPDDMDPNTFLAEEIYEIVKDSIAPGIDFRIVYVDGV
jgi:hypothetical protein